MFDLDDVDAAPSITPVREGPNEEAPSTRVRADSSWSDVGIGNLNRSHAKEACHDLGVLSPGTGRDDVFSDVNDVHVHVFTPQGPLPSDSSPPAGEIHSWAKQVEVSSAWTSARRMLGLCINVLSPNYLSFDSRAVEVRPTQ